MWALWQLVGAGEIVDTQSGATRWSIDWTALQTLIWAEHELTIFDPPGEICEAMLAVKRALMQPVGALLVAERVA